MRTGWLCSSPALVNTFAALSPRSHALAGVLCLACACRAPAAAPETPAVQRIQGDEAQAPATASATAASQRVCSVFDTSAGTAPASAPAPGAAAGVIEAISDERSQEDRVGSRRVVARPDGTRYVAGEVLSAGEKPTQTGLEIVRELPPHSFDRCLALAD